MADTVETIAKNIRRFREVKNLSQKEISVESGIPQGQYSRIENGKVEPAVSTLEKIAKVFEVSISDLLKEKSANETDVNMPLLEKIRLIDQLEEKEKSSILTVIDMAIAKKRFKDNLSQLIAS